MSNREFTDDYIKGLLRDHFKAEVAQQPAAKHPWDWLKTRLESPPIRTGFVGFLNRIPKPLVAGLAVFAVLVGATMWTSLFTARSMSHLDFRPESAFVPAGRPGFTGHPGVSGAPGPPGSPAVLAAPTPLAWRATAAGSASQSDTKSQQEDNATFAIADRGQLSSAHATPPDSPPPAQSESTQEDEELADAVSASDPGASSVATPVPIVRVENQVAPAPPPSATTFKDYEHSRFASTQVDKVSTFSLDTDRTSFQLALNWARAGYMVEPDSVRAEEWINSFNYDYDPPAHRDSFGITADVFRHPLDSDMHMVRLGFQAPDLHDDTPLNVTLVLDASGSMAEGNRVAIAREAADSIRRSLSSRDRIGIVQFTTDVIHDLTVEHTTPDHRAVSRSIDRLVPNKSTNVQAGLDLGVRLADRARRQRPDAHNYIILMSDGVANVNATDPFAILESAHDADASNPLRLITIGVGIENYNDYLLEQLAQHGNGWYRYLSDVNQARATFSRDNWLALSVPFADQTRAQVTWGDNVVEYWRMIGYENRVTPDESFTEDRKEFAEIPMGAATTVFFEVQLKDAVLRGRSNVADLGDVHLRWVTPMTGLTNRQAAAITSQFDRELGTTGDPLLEFGAIVALASDRYGSLPYVDGSLPYVDAGASSEIRHDLQVLSDRLQSLNPQLGHLDSYQDFAFLLDRMMTALPTGTRSNNGYSR